MTSEFQVPTTDQLLLPPIRWAGGKQYLVRPLLQYVPAQLADLRYHEPFLGAGSLFFALQPRRATLADANHHIIECYKWIRKCPTLIARYLTRHAAMSSEKHYYSVRSAYNCGRSSAAQAARFIYLNKAAFHGVFRVNKRGEFNVPYGWSEPPVLPSRSALKRVSNALKKSSLHVRPFSDSLTKVKDGDFVYLDPPYPPLNGTSFFVHYTPDGFGMDDQAQLARCARIIANRGALVLMSNADTDDIRNLYSDFRIHTLQATRFVSIKKTKVIVNELVITSYES